MGVSGLRKLLEDVVYISSLPQMAWEHWEEHREPLRIGIDSSIWLVQVSFIHRAHPKADPVKILFHKLFRLYSSPLVPVFVFDGPYRPSVKRGNKVDTSRPVVGERKLREMCKALGFACWTAPGEAEAELSYLASVGRLDVVVTEDSDALLFGAPVVLSKPMRRGEKKLQPDEFKVYRLEDIKRMHEVDCKGLILVALMGGADYDIIGIEKCTVAMALAIARYGFGNTLLEGYAKHPPAYFAHPFLPAWRKQIKECFLYNPQGILPRRYPSVAKLVYDNFPDLAVVDLHVHPVTSERAGKPWPGFEDGDGPKEVRDAARAAQGVFGWREGRLLEKLRRALWQGAIVRALVRELQEPGAWAAGCAAVGLSHDARSSTASSSSARVTDYFGGSKPPPAHPRTPEKRARCTQEDGNSSPWPSSFEVQNGPATTFPSSPPLLLKITLERTIDGRLPEFRVLVDPARFVLEALEGLQVPISHARALVGTSLDSSVATEADDAFEVAFDDEGADATPSSVVEDPFRPVLVWLPQPIVTRTHPDLVRAYRSGDPAKGKARESGLEGMQAGLETWLAKGKTSSSSRLAFEMDATRNSEIVEIVNLLSSQPQHPASDASDVVCLPAKTPSPGPSSTIAHRPCTPTRSGSSTSTVKRACMPSTPSHPSPARPTPSKVPRIAPAPASAPSSDPFEEDDISYADIDLSWLAPAVVQDQHAGPEEEDGFDCDWIKLTVSQEERLLGG